MSHTKVGIFIPCYNANTAVTNVLASFSDEVLSEIAEILVVDNQSTDDTAERIQAFQKEGNATSKKTTLFINRSNQGLGGSQKVAYDYFLKNGFTHFMIIHGDNQGNGNEIAKSFLKEWKANPEVDFIAASRFLKSADITNYHPLKAAGNRFFNLLTWSLTGLHMSDAGCGIIFVKTKILKDINFTELTNSFQFNPQLNILVYGNKNLQIREIPLDWKESEVGSGIDSLRYCMTLSKILLNYRITKKFEGALNPDWQQYTVCRPA